MRTFPTQTDTWRVNGELSVFMPGQWAQASTALGKAGIFTLIERKPLWLDLGTWNGC
jgi:hypothetical protein